MDRNLLLTTTAKKLRHKNFTKRKHPFPIFSNETDAGNNRKFKCYIGYLEENCVVIKDEETIKRVFSMGFFGKGTLSRSTPKVCLESRQQKDDTESMDDTESRSSSNSEVEIEIHTSETTRKKENEDHTTSENENDNLQDDSLDVKKTEETASEPEMLQLTLEEAFFLSYALGCLVVKDKDQPMDLLRLWQTCCDLTSDGKFPIMYTAYHHFRSKGWVVRSGLKYGSDFVLYKDGPPFYHSTYAVIVKAVKEKHFKETYHNNRLQLTWPSLTAANRVVTHSAKGLMFLYVIKPEMMSDNKILTPFCVSKFKLQEVLVKRFVPSSEREDDD